MSLFYIFYIIVGVSVAGIGYVVWLMSTDSDNSNAGIEKINPEELRQFNRTGKLSPVKEKNIPAPKPLKNPSPMNATKISAIPDKKQPKAPGKLKMFGGKKDKRPDLNLNDIKAANELDPFEPKKSNSFMDKLNLKLSFGKKKINPQDDIPEATKFASLTEKSTFPASSDSQKKERAEPATGTASLTTTHYDETTAGQSDRHPSGDISVKNDLTVMKRELESSAQLAEWKEKYEKLDALFKEKSQQLEKAGSSLDNEIKNREDFFKLKAILESEIKEVKDRARDLQHALKNARMETEQQKLQAEQLKNKVTELEETIQEKNQDQGGIKKPEPPAV